uniref:Proline rich 7, synaptic n=1 Tax=Seriola lalandi dorsalis TaxID=1841481 RepID=A0A3B4ZCL2_SERLL
MVMSQGTYTFLACFAGFWLVWAFIVMLCCFCSFLQRRLKRRREERLREQCLRTVEMEPLGCQPAGYPEPPQFCPPRTLSPPLPVLNHVVIHLNSQSPLLFPDADVFGKPPCYEEAVLMEDPPPPYSEVLADPRGGTYLKPAPLRAAPPPLREHQDPAPVFTSETSKLPAATVFPDRGYSSLIRLPSSQRWDSLGHLLSNMDLHHNNFTPPGGRSLQAAAAMATMPRREGFHGGLPGLQGVHGLRGLEPSCGLPTAFPLLGRSTAV